MFGTNKTSKLTKLAIILLFAALLLIVGVYVFYRIQHPDSQFTKEFGGLLPQLALSFVIAIAGLYSFSRPMPTHVSEAIKNQPPKSAKEKLVLKIIFITLAVIMAAFFFYGVFEYTQQ